jgi:hypothetical protein
MRRKLFGRAVQTSILVAAGLVVLATLRSTAILTAAPEAPAIRIGTLSKVGCGVECQGISVSWVTDVPTGVTFTSFKITVVPPTPCTGCFQLPLPPVTVSGKSPATSAIVGVSSGGIPSGSYTATVAASYTGGTCKVATTCTVSASKTQTI